MDFMFKQLKAFNYQMFSVPTRYIQSLEAKDRKKTHFLTFCCYVAFYFEGNQFAEKTMFLSTGCLKATFQKLSDSVRLLLAWLKISASLAVSSVLLDSTKPQHIKDE